MSFLLFSDRVLARVLLTCIGVGIPSLLLEAVFGTLTTLPIVLLTLMAWLIAGLWTRFAFADMENEVSLEGREATPQTEFYISIVILGAAMAHLLFYVFEYHGQVMMKNANLNGDFPFHWHMTMFLERGPSFWPQNPLFQLDHLRYAFGVNWLSALALRTGLPFGVVLLVPIVLATWAVWNQLWKWAGIWGVVAFFGSGGGWWMSSHDWSSLWAPGDRLAWKNLFLSILVTQRGFWFALPAGLLWLRLLIEMHRNPWLARRSRWHLLFCIWAVFPFFHLHTFVLLTLFGGLLILSGGLRSQIRQIWKPVLIWSLIPLFFIINSVNAQNSVSAIRVVQNWMSETQNLAVSLGANFGPWLLFVFLLLVGYIFDLRIRGRKFLGQGDEKPILIWLLLGVVFFQLMLAPWNWDQTKIILWIYLGLSVLMARALIGVLPRVVYLALLFLLHLPGLVQFSGGLPPRMSSYPLWSISDQKSVESLVSGLPVEERVLVAPSPHHPILATGQAIVAGYPGHIWSQGISIAGMEDQLRRWVIQAPDLKADQKSVYTFRGRHFEPRYLLWGPVEKSYFGVDAPTATLEGNKQWVMVKNSGSWSLYSLQAF